MIVCFCCFLNYSAKRRVMSCFREFLFKAFLLFYFSLVDVGLCFLLDSYVASS